MGEYDEKGKGSSEGHRDDAGRLLKALGYVASLDTLSVSELEGKIKEFQSDQGLEATGKLNEATMEILRKRAAAAPPFLKRVSKGDRENIEKVSGDVNALVVQISDILAPYFDTKSLPLSQFTVHASQRGQVSISFKPSAKRFGSNVFCFCVPPGICVPCDPHPGCPDLNSETFHIVASAKK